MNPTDVLSLLAVVGAGDGAGVATAAGASFPHLAVLILLPLAGALLLLLVPGEQKGLIRALALSSSLAVLAVALRVLAAFDPGVGGMQLEVAVPWIPSLGASFHLGVDGLSLFLVLLTTVLTPVALLSTFRAVSERVKEFMVSFLVLETGMLGALVALDLLLFYLFWEVMLVPMYLLIGVFGGERRVLAAVKFVLFTVAGSLLMLVALLYLYLKTPEPHSFDLATILGTGGLGVQEQLYLFAAFALAFAIKVPMVPVHTWLPDAHTEAPTAGSVILAAVLLKMGTYGFLRFAMPLFPDALRLATPLLMGLAVVGIVHGALVAMVQKDVKRLVAYSSVSHLGFVMLGLLSMTPEGISGGVYQMLAHGVTTGGLFLAVGFLYERRHTRDIEEFGGLAREVPVFAAVLLLICLGSAGLPGLAGFVGEFTILLGTFHSAAPFARVLAALAATGIIFAAVYLLWTYMRVMFGPVTNPRNWGLKDLTGREVAYFLPVVLLTVGMGVFPTPILDRVNPSVAHFLETHARRQALLSGVAPATGTAASLVPAPSPASSARDALAREAPSPAEAAPPAPSSPTGPASAAGGGGAADPRSLRPRLDLNVLRDRGRLLLPARPDLRGLMDRARRTAGEGR